MLSVARLLSGENLEMVGGGGVNFARVHQRRCQGEISTHLPSQDTWSHLYVAYVPGLSYPLTKAKQPSLMGSCHEFYYQSKVGPVVISFRVAPKVYKEQLARH